jgi:tellurite resistance protein TehA-like permease
VVGPVGLGLCWKKMSQVWGNNKILETISLVILGWTVFQMTLLLILMGYRSIRYPKISFLEQKHPTHFIFGILGTLYFCLISSFIIHWNQGVAKVFWYIGFATMCIYMIYTAHRFLVQKIPVAQMNAFYLFGPLPVLLAVQLAPYAPKDLLFFGWSVGTIWYFGLHVFLVFRWIHIGLPQKKDRAAMWLLLAASADSVLAYAAASPYGFGEPAKAIFFFAILQFVVLISMSQKIFQSGFVAAWWMTTLPSTAFASCWLSYGISINHRAIIIVGTVLTGAATVWILVLYVMTAIWMIRKDFLPKTPYRPPVERHPLS